MSKETVEQFLARGGKIEVLPPQALGAPRVRCHTDDHGVTRYDEGVNNQGFNTPIEQQARGGRR